MIEDRAPKTGELFQNKRFAKVLMAAGEGPEQFYTGWVGQAIVKRVQSLGGKLSLDDLQHQCQTGCERITPQNILLEDYREKVACEMPPNGQGIVASLAMSILNQFSLEDEQFQSTRHLHLMIEALRLAFTDARHYVCDPQKADIPIKMLLSQEYAQQRMKLVSEAKAAISAVSVDVERLFLL